MCGCMYVCVGVRVGGWMYVCTIEQEREGAKGGDQGRGPREGTKGGGQGRGPREGTKGGGQGRGPREGTKRGDQGRGPREGTNRGDQGRCFIRMCHHGPLLCANYFVLGIA